MSSSRSSQLKLDEVGDWSRLKIEIIGQYAHAYTTILINNERIRLNPIYVDGFAGAGELRLKRTGELIEGSPLKAFAVQPPFDWFYLIDLDGKRAASLKRIAEGRSNVTVEQGDCNEVLLKKVFPRILGNRLNRGLCILDPYGVHLDWEVLRQAGESKHIEIFLNFATLDMQKNMFRKNRDKVRPSDIARMNRFWGDNSWEEIIYKKSAGLFGDMESKEAESNREIVKAFQKRLREHAGFGFVPDPVPMCNSKGVLYYLFFAAPRTTGGKLGGEIVKQIFENHRRKGSIKCL
jgi:three-Cys-motif partner protein